MLVASVGNVLVWIVWVGAAFACLASGVAVVSFSNPFFSALALIGNLAALAVMYLLLSLEIMLNAANLALIAFARHHGRGGGQIFALAVMAVAASEVVVGLGLIVAMARQRLVLDVDRFSRLRG